LIFGHFASIWITDLAFVIGHGVAGKPRYARLSASEKALTPPRGLLFFGTPTPSRVLKQSREGAAQQIGQIFDAIF
jgi:hypothetical protein